MGGQIGAVIDRDDFYGQVRAAAKLTASHLLGSATELFATIEAYRYQTVISSISAAESHIGHLAFGGLQRIAASETAVVAAMTRVVLPTAVGIYQRSLPLGLQAGLTAEWSLSEALRVHAQTSVVASAALSAVASDPRLGLVAGVSGGYQLLPWLALLGGVSASFAYVAPLDLLAANTGLRVGSQVFSVELSGLMRIAGERTPWVAALQAQLRPW